MTIVNSGPAAPPSGLGLKSGASWRLGLAVLCGAAIALAPSIGGLQRPAQYVLAVTAFSVVLWAFQVMNNGVASILMMGLLILGGVRVPLVLSGFGGPQFWVLLCVLFYGFAMQQTGLARRLSLYLLSLFPATYGGILTAFFLIGLLLALGVPSMTVRTAIMVPIAWELTQSLGLGRRTRASALVVLTTVEMAIIPGCAFLYGSLYGPVVDSLFRAKALPITWLGYAEVMTLPTILLCVLLIVVNPLVLRPEKKLQMSSTFASEGLAALGPVSRAELITALIVVLSTAYWATDRLHHLPSFLVGMFALAVFALSGIVTDKDIGGGVSWTLLLFLGGIFSLANVIQEYKIPEWLAGYLVPIASRLTFSTMLVLLLMALLMYVVRFIDPTGFIALAVLFLPVVDVTNTAGIPPLVLMAALLLAVVPFWASYQNIWVAMGEGVTGNEAFAPPQRIALANAYAVLALVTIVVSVAYWKTIGVL